MQVVNKGLKVRLYPCEDMIGMFEQGMGNARFVWNHILKTQEYYNKLALSHGYPRMKCTLSNFNTILMMLKKEYSFLYLSESTSLQQVYRDLQSAFKHFFNDGYNYPKFKTKRNPKQSFRIQKVGNNVRVTNKRIRLAKIGFVHYQTSKEYRRLLKTSKINNVTVKKENGKYYAIVNIKLMLMN